MRVKEESEKVGLTLNIQKMKIMTSSPITSWQIDGETVETVSDFILVGSKITADGDCSHEIKRRLLLGRKVMTNLDSIFKSRDITLPTKVCLVRSNQIRSVAQSCPTLCDPMDYSLPGFSVHGIFQARVLDQIRSGQVRSVTQSCPTLCNPMNCSTPGLPVHY